MDPTSRRSRSSRPGTDGLRRSGGDAVQLVIDYVKQETLVPLKGLGRYVGYGILGSLSLCVGVLLLLVALLRLLQTETSTTFTGNLSWLPYLIVSLAAAVVMALAVWRIAQGPAARRRPEEDGGAHR
jgi:peptidoglycan biosynthesis protein MviN/MurJ (putative lipid II flippase)